MNVLPEITCSLPSPVTWSNVFAQIIPIAAYYLIIEEYIFIPHE
jgi:hypothetical protein